MIGSRAERFVERAAVEHAPRWRRWCPGLALSPATWADGGRTASTAAALRTNEGEIGAQPLLGGPTPQAAGRIAARVVSGCPWRHRIRRTAYVPAVIRGHGLGRRPRGLWLRRSTGQSPRHSTFWPPRWMVDQNAVKGASEIGDWTIGGCRPDPAAPMPTEIAMGPDGPRSTTRTTRAGILLAGILDPQQQGAGRCRPRRWFKPTFVGSLDDQSARTRFTSRGIGRRDSYIRDQRAARPLCRYYPCRSCRSVASAMMACCLCSHLLHRRGGNRSGTALRAGVWKREINPVVKSIS